MTDIGRMRGDRGAGTAELVVITPVALVLLCLVALVGRTTEARGMVDGAARDAARAASFERDADSARTAAETSAARFLNGSGIRCVDSHVDADVTSFAAGGQVSVEVSCEVNLSDLGLIGLSGTRSISARSVEPIDVYRGIEDS